MEFYEKFVTKHNYGQSMSYKAKAVLKRFLNGPGMNSRAFEEKVKDRSRVRASNLEVKKCSKFQPSDASKGVFNDSFIVEDRV